MSTLVTDLMLTVVVALTITACGSSASNSNGTAAGSTADMGGSTTDGGGVAADALPLANLMHAYLHSQCASSFRCCPALAPDGLTVDMCADRTFAIAGAEIQAAIEADVAAGRATYDGAVAQQCVDDFEQIPCAEPITATNPSPFCSESLTPQVQLGGECAALFSCVNGYCDATGTCQALKQVGQSCDDDFECRTVYCSAGQCEVLPGDSWSELCGAN